MPGGVGGAEALTIYGVDVSRWNKVNWRRLLARPEDDFPGVQFAGVRASWGARGVDPMLINHRAGAATIGALEIPYHVVDPWVAASIQVAHFLATLGRDIGRAWMLDVEPTPGARPADYAQWAEVTAAMAYDLSARTGAPPCLYGSPSFLERLPLPLDLDGAPLWLAAWRNGPADEARRPALAVRPWRRVTIWQVGTRPLADGAPVDWDRYEGTRAELERELAVGLTHAVG